MRELAACTAVRLVELGAAAPRLRRTWGPSYRTRTIPAGTYPGMADAVDTVAVPNLLVTVAAIPFPTALVAKYLQAGHDQQVAAFAYGVTMSCMAVAFSVFTLYARRYRRTYVPLDWLGFATA